MRRQLHTVAIYVQEDRLAIHRFKADETYVVGEGKRPVVNGPFAKQNRNDC